MWQKGLPSRKYTALPQICCVSQGKSLTLSEPRLKTEPWLSPLLTGPWATSPARVRRAAQADWVGGEEDVAWEGAVAHKGPSPG